LITICDRYNFVGKPMQPAEDLRPILVERRTLRQR